jgi:hypothetical protein
VAHVRCPGLVVLEEVVVEGFVVRGRSVWCERCGDQVTTAGDPLAEVTCRAHGRGCTGRMSQVRSRSNWQARWLTR